MDYTKFQYLCPKNRNKNNRQRASAGETGVDGRGGGRNGTFHSENRSAKSDWQKRTFPFLRGTNNVPPLRHHTSSRGWKSQSALTWAAEATTCRCVGVCASGKKGEKRLEREEDVSWGGYSDYSHWGEGGKALCLTGSITAALGPGPPCVSIQGHNEWTAFQQDCSFPLVRSLLA